MHDRTSRCRLSLIGLGFALVLLGGTRGTVRAESPLRADLAGHGGVWVVGDRETIIATVTNTGTKPLHDLVVTLSLLDMTGSPAVPLRLEDWTPAPEAAHAASLAPAEKFTWTWRLRMIQSGRLAMYATVVTGDDPSVANSTPIVLDVSPAHNLTRGRVLPTAIGMPLVLLAANAAVFWRRRRNVGREMVRKTLQ